jgi:hypothetical protein
MGRIPKRPFHELAHVLEIVRKSKGTSVIGHLLKQRVAGVSMGDMRPTPKSVTDP